MFLLQMLVVFSAFLSTQQQVEHDCGAVFLDYHFHKKYNYSLPNQTCTRASLVRFADSDYDFAKKFKKAQSVEILNSLTTIDSSNLNCRHLVSLHIENTYLTYSPVAFLPNLTAIIPAPNTTTSVLLIRQNAELCIPENVMAKLLNMVNGQGYIEPCPCFAKRTTSSAINELVNRTYIISGGNNCRRLTGGLVFTENSTLTEEMRKRLEAVEIIYGPLRLSNTNFTSFDFLKNLKKVIYMNIEPGRTISDRPAVLIVGNRKLKSLGFLLEIIRDYKKVDTRRLPLVILQDNPLLKFSPVEEQYYTTFITTEMDFKTREDPIKVDLHPCVLVNPLRENLDSIKDCTDVTGDLTIDNSFDGLSPVRMDEIFGDLRVLKGCLAIQGTKLINLNFLHDLMSINCTGQRPAVLIVDNPELKWLDVQVHDFEGSEDTVTIKIVNNPKLCRREVDYLKTIMTSNWRLIEFDLWGQKCRDVRLYSTSWLPYYYASAAGILVVGMGVLEVVVQLVRRRRRQKKERAE